uniref:Uncharacterized protein n=1 Tax=Utricularia reniformis TaxID=192314 RepID=A0A1Y0B242_9LAMI|nr:hypothetical protein AEK19_MT1327 [Utricularia reniformis]ART31525.1 hypothetical protein AEK19_MT1327 [Utricularia reniformis]
MICKLLSRAYNYHLDSKTQFQKLKLTKFFSYNNRISLSMPTLEMELDLVMCGMQVHLEDWINILFTAWNNSVGFQAAVRVYRSSINPLKDISNSSPGFDQRARRLSTVE